MTNRDTELLLDLFLEEGPAVLPDRVLEAVRADIHRHQRRTLGGPGRFIAMRNYLAAAAGVAVVAIGGGVLLATRLPGPSVSRTPIPSPSSALPEAQVTLRAGRTYKLSRLSSPLSLKMPAGAPTFSLDRVGAGSLRLMPTSGGAITLHDGAALPNDLCHPTGVITKVPTDVEGWLLKSGHEMTVTPMQRLGKVRYWDITLGPRCYRGGQPHAGPEIWLSAGEHHRVYEIPVLLRSGEIKTLIAFTWGAGYEGAGDQVLQQLNPIANAVVQSIQAY
jgi:hypothetical protein